MTRKTFSYIDKDLCVRRLFQIRIAYFVNSLFKHILKSKKILILRALFRKLLEWCHLFKYFPTSSSSKNSLTTLESSCFLEKCACTPITALPRGDPLKLHDVPSLPLVAGTLLHTSANLLRLSVPGPLSCRNHLGPPTLGRGAAHTTPQPSSFAVLPMQERSLSVPLRFTAAAQAKVTEPTRRDKVGTLGDDDQR